MIDETPALAVHCSGHASAAVVADDQHVLYLEHVDGELQHRQIVCILRRGEIGDIAMDKQLAGVQAHDLIRRYPTVGAADPQIVWPLLTLESFEEAGVGGEPALDTGFFKRPEGHRGAGYL